VSERQASVEFTVPFEDRIADGAPIVIGHDVPVTLDGRVLGRVVSHRIVDGAVVVEVECVDAAVANLAMRWGWTPVGRMPTTMAAKLG
jgi:hypothetical protein